MEVFRVLNHTHDFPQKTAFNITLRVFRGGGLLKDMVYLRGLMTPDGVPRRRRRLEPLLVGKFGAGHLLSYRSCNGARCFRRHGSHRDISKPRGRRATGLVSARHDGSAGLVKGM